MVDINKEKKRMQFEKELLEYNERDRVVSSLELYNHLVEKHKNKPIVSLSSGIPTIDLYMDGFEGGELTAISGKSGQGKTLFMQTLTKHFSKNNQNIIWFSYEVQPMQFLRKFGDNIPNFYSPMELTSGNMKWIYNRIYESKLKYSVVAVCIDHLHFLADLIIKRNPSLEIGKIIRTLKVWALELNISFFLIAHNKKSTLDRELDLGDIRDSSFIEQESDNVFYIWRSKKRENEAILKIVKNRRMGVFDKKVRLKKIDEYLKEIVSDY